MKNLKKLLVAGMLATSMFMMTAPVNAVGAEACSHPALIRLKEEPATSEVIVGTQDICYVVYEHARYECGICNDIVVISRIIEEHAHNWNIATIINGVPYGRCTKCNRPTPSND